MQQNYFGYYQPQAQMSIDRVTNLDEAKKYQMYPGGIVYLKDQEAPYIYLKTCDPQGKTTIRAFSLLEVDVNKIRDSKYITREDFDEFKNDIISIIKGGNVNESTVK